MAEKKRDTKFKPGKSGNPGGRPVGSGWVGTARDEMRSRWPKIRDKLFEKAEDGDLTAIRLVAERLFPPIKAAEQETPVALVGDSLTEKANGILDALSSGALAPTQASQLLQALGSVAKVVEVDELLRRIEALEAKEK